MIHDTQSAQISQKQDGRNIYVIMKTMCPPGYHKNGFMTTHALGHMMYILLHIVRQRFIAYSKLVEKNGVWGLFCKLDHQISLELV